MQRCWVAKVGLSRRSGVDVGKAAFDQSSAVRASMAANVGLNVRERVLSTRLSHSVSTGARLLSRRYETFAGSATVTGIRTFRAAERHGQVASWAHNPKDVGSNPTSPTKEL